MHGAGDARKDLDLPERPGGLTGEPPGRGQRKATLLVQDQASRAGRLGGLIDAALDAESLADGTTTAALSSVVKPTSSPAPQPFVVVPNNDGGRAVRLGRRCPVRCASHFLLRRRTRTAGRTTPSAGPKYAGGMKHAEDPALRANHPEGVRSTGRSIQPFSPYVEMEMTRQDPGRYVGERLGGLEEDAEGLDVASR